MKHKTAELEGALLDQAVTLANAGQNPSWTGERCPTWSMSWHLAGLIIQRERITIVASIGYGEPLFWSAKCGEFNHYIDEPLYGGRNPASSWQGTGPTPLIAAMRAFVESKLGDEVEL